MPGHRDRPTTAGPRRVVVAALGAVLASGMLAGCAGTSQAPTTTEPAAAQSTAATHSAGTPAPVVSTGLVIKVTDGDTVHVAVDGGPANEDVRIIGVDTPEVVDPRKPVQCFGPQASTRAHTLLDRAKVKLSTDPTQATVDVHGRALRVLTLADGSNYAETTVAAGYGRAYKVRGPAPSNWATLTRDESEARAAQRGLWAPRPTGCSGGT